MDSDTFRPGHKPENVPARRSTDVVSAVGDVAYRWSIKDDLIEWGEGVESLLGVANPECFRTGRAFGARSMSQKGASRYEAVMYSRESDNGSGVRYEIEYQLLDDYGGLRWVEDRGRWFADAEGKPEVAVGVLRAIDQRRVRDDQLVRLSTYDELTGLLNRVRLKGELADVVVQARAPSAFLLLAIDNLARINDSYGFDVGDEVIVGVAERLRGLSRRADALGRYSGNKFGVALRNCSPERLSIIAERMLASVRDQVIQTSRGPVAITMSGGCVSLPFHAQTVEAALAHAEEALMSAKQTHRDSYVVYTPSREREKTRQRNIDIADELISALNDRRICLAYQPIFSSQSGEVEIYECLIRLMREDGSIIAAGNFVPIAEKLGLIGLLDYRVMELAIETLRARPDVKLALNVSGRTTSDRMWLDGLVAQLRADLSLAARLTVEITETVAIQDIAETADFVSQLRDLGCLIAIDDFGAGYTSFRNLRALDVDLVKIDGSFVQNLLENRDNQFFVKTLVELAHNFNLPTVAEWVSNADEVAMLRDLGVEYLQGFYLGEPQLTLPEQTAQSTARA
ncbi:EAL domain-containing protein [Parvibaculum sedimenti]|uniref:EAL domain-containing protein n=1 Tax=Parvibaculum sedimenti TaxID=2608632 RepID=A0A6N6VKN0_9HYPH|nr:bifunctional diguanylate cyclase/phosphodiesterase [Parvibaculum sedimenti]KAB7742060.1 EAL domain-containing protein [Parvibaculum sedimenti]